MREDIAMESYALEMGFKVEKGSVVVDGQPKAPLKFKKGNVHVWLGSFGWMVAEDHNGSLYGRELIGPLREALDEAVRRADHV